MVLPIGDSPNPRDFPLVNYGLIVANLAIYLIVSFPLMNLSVDLSDPTVQQYLRVVTDASDKAVDVSALAEQVSAYDIYVFRHGFRPSNPTLEGLFLSLFLHAGLVHLLGNMLILWIYGDNIEHRLGRIGYLICYLGSGLLATLFYFVSAAGSALPLIGASGAISGVLGLYFRWFPHNKVRLFVFLFPILMDVFVVPARVVLGFYLLADNVLPFLFTSSTGGGVAYGAHIGGFLAGMVLAWALDRREPRVAAESFARGDEPASPSAIHHAIAEGNFEAAAHDYFTLPRRATRQILPPDEAFAFAEWLRRARQPRAALTVYRRLLSDPKYAEAYARAHLGAGLVQLEDLEQPTAAYQHFLDALDSNPDEETIGRARAGLRAIVEQQKFQLHRPRHDA